LDHLEGLDHLDRLDRLDLLDPEVLEGETDQLVAQGQEVMWKYPHWYDYSGNIW
jgi:hypothetical protein